VVTCFNRAGTVPDRDRPSRFARRTPQDPLTRRDESLAFVADDETWRPPAWFERIAVVLVEPTDAVNIGGVIRAMANTGFVHLRMVNPVGFDPWHIVGVAHYTQHLIQAARTFDTLERAVADRHFVLGLTGRHHRAKRNALAITTAIEQIREVATGGGEVAIVFGREDSGLSNAMLDACHAVTTIPTNPAYPSLNLAQAALLVLYRLFERARGQDQNYRPPRKRAAAAPSSLLEDLFADIERSLDAIGFLGSRSREHTLRSVRVALYRAQLDVREASLLRAMAIEVRRFLRREGIIADVGPIGAQSSRSGTLTGE
jgi:TrmH family RNA methyltransferase